MDTKVFSLIDFCSSCGAKCCKVGDFSGSPLLSQKEVDAITAFCEKKFGSKPTAFKKILVGKGSYFVFAEKNGEYCPFLGADKKCVIQEVKPIDCMDYPIKAVHTQDGSMRLIVDSSCPAAKHLSKEFIGESRRLAVGSLARFPKEVREHLVKSAVACTVKVEANDSLAPKAK